MTTRGPREAITQPTSCKTQVSANLKQARADDATAPARCAHSAILNDLKLLALAGVLFIFPLIIMTNTALITFYGPYTTIKQFNAVALLNLKQKR